MDELIESTSIDPMEPLTDQQRAEREEIYKQHALESATWDHLFRHVIWALKSP
ncbi:MAG: hypothetical protein ACPIOQ_81575 [Promethearchaeia archaeon]